MPKAGSIVSWQLTVTSELDGRALTLAGSTLRDDVEPLAEALAMHARRSTPTRA